MHHKLIVFGLILVAVVVFGTLFWENFSATQQEIANTPMGMTPYQSSNTSGMSSSDDLDSIEADLNTTDVNGIDSDNSSLQAELNSL